MAAGNCQTCGLPMPSIERTIKQYSNQSGIWHHDCAYLEHLRDVGFAQQPFERAEVNKAIAKLVARKNGQPTHYP